MQRSVLALTCAIGVIGANSLVLSPISGTVAKGLAAAGPADVLIASAAYGVATALSALALAPLSDRLGADRVLTWALAAVCLGLIGSAVTPNLTGLSLAQGLAGMGAGAALPAIYGLAAVVAPPGRAAQTMGTVLTGWTLSLVAGVSLSAVVADVVGWRGVFAILGGLAALLLAWTTTTQFTDVPRGHRTSPLSALRVQGIGRALLSAGLTMLAFYGVYNYTGPHIVSELGAPTWIAGMLALTYGGGFGAAVLLDSQIDRIGARRAAPAVFAVLMTIYGAIALTAGQLWVLLAVGFGWGIINHLSLNLIVGRLTALDPAQRGAILGLYSAVTYAAVTIGTLGFRPAYDAAGLAACAWIAVVLVAAMVTEAATRKA